MNWEPWSKGIGLSRSSAGTAFGSVGPIAVRVRVLYVSLTPETDSSQELRVAVTVSEQPIRILADMNDQHAVFGRGQFTLTLGPRAWLVRMFGGITTERRWYWDLEPQTGPFWVHFAYQSFVAGDSFMACGVVGVRRVE